jgi:hypothetical protein
MRDLGLKDNPFNPRLLRGGARRYLQSLDRRPLRIDVCAAVEHLYFEELPVASKHLVDWVRRLADAGYSPGNPRGLSNLVAVIRGGTGSGKTTLAAKFLRHLLSCGGSDDAAWVDVGDSFPDTDITRSLPTTEEIDKVCGSVGRALEGKGEDNWTYAFIDNVTEKSLGPILNVYDTAGSCTRIFVLTTDDVDLVVDDPAYPIEVADYQLGELDVDAAVAYARFRVASFRHGDHLETPLCDSMFPLLAEAVHQWTGRDPNASAGNPLVIRVLNTVLGGKIDSLAKRFADPEIQNLPPPANVTRDRLEKLLREV